MKIRNLNRRHTLQRSLTGAETELDTGMAQRCTTGRDLHSIGDLFVAECCVIGSGFSSKTTDPTRVYNSILKNLLRLDDSESISFMLDKMVRDKIPPNSFTILTSMKACARFRDVELAWDIFTQWRREFNIQPTTGACNALLRTCLNAQDAEKANAVWDMMDQLEIEGDEGTQELKGELQTVLGVRSEGSIHKSGQTSLDTIAMLENQVVQLKEQIADLTSKEGQVDAPISDEPESDIVSAAPTRKRRPKVPSALPSLRGEQAHIVTHTILVLGTSLEELWSQWMELIVDATDADASKPPSLWMINPKLYTTDSSGNKRLDPDVPRRRMMIRFIETIADGDLSDDSIQAAISKIKNAIVDIKGEKWTMNKLHARMMNKDMKGPFMGYTFKIPRRGVPGQFVKVAETALIER